MTGGQTEAGLARRRAGGARHAGGAGSAAVLFLALSLVAGALVGVVRAEPAAAAPTLPSGFRLTTVLSGLDYPTAVRFAPDGTVFVAEKRGMVQVFSSLVDPTPSVFADLRVAVSAYWDKGLTGIVLDPQYPARPYVYLLYAYDHVLGDPAPPPKWSDGCPNPPGGTTNGCVTSGRLVRVTSDLADPPSMVAGSESVLVEDWCSQYPGHTVDDLAFGPDGMLYASAGDGSSWDFADWGQNGFPQKNPCGDPPGGVGAALSAPSSEGGALRSQDVRTWSVSDPTGLGGTIIRVDPDTGLAPTSNPNYAAGADENARRILSYGHRNPFRITFKPGTDDLWVAEVGWDRREEINRIATLDAMRNFGWPCYEGPEVQTGYSAFSLCQSLPQSQTVAPWFSYRHVDEAATGDGCPTGGSSMTGVAFINGGSLGDAQPLANWPARYDGALLFADYSRNCIWAMLRGAGGEPDPTKVEPFGANVGTPVQLVIGPDGDPYVVDIASGTIRRIDYFPGNRPPLAAVNADKVGGPLPLQVNFDAGASSDEDGDALTYAWDLDGDGQFDDATGVGASGRYTNAANRTVRVRVRDTAGNEDVASVLVTPGNSAPTAVIDLPASTLRWVVGQSIAFSGRATDPDVGELGRGALSWSLDMQHCDLNGSCHTHVIRRWDGVSSGSFTATDHAYPSHLRLTLTAQDSRGLSSTQVMELYPQTATLRIESVPPGLSVTTGSQAETTPYEREVIVGSANTLSALSQTLGGSRYDFDAWSDGGAATHTVTVSGPRTLTAIFSNREVRAARQVVTEPTNGTAASTIKVPILLNGPATVPVSVAWRTRADTARAPADFTTASGSVTFAPGQTRKDVSLVIRGDARDEPDERLWIDLSNPSSARVRVASAAVVILDNDGPATPTVVVNLSWPQVELLEAAAARLGAKPADLPRRGADLMRYLDAITDVGDPWSEPSNAGNFEFEVGYPSSARWAEIRAVADRRKVSVSGLHALGWQLMAFLALSG